MLYLIHADAALERGTRKGAQHYLGWSLEQNLGRRVSEHLRGKSGVTVVQQWRKRGIDYHLVAIWPGAPKAAEREIKSESHLDLWCPVCAPQAGRSGSLLAGIAVHRWPIARARRLTKHKTARSGAQFNSTRTNYAGPFQVPLNLEFPTNYDAPERALLTSVGGNDTPALAQPVETTSRSVGTRLLSTSGSST